MGRHATRRGGYDDEVAIAIMSGVDQIEFADCHILLSLGVSAGRDVNLSLPSGLTRCEILSARFLSLFFGCGVEDLFAVRWSVSLDHLSHDLLAFATEVLGDGHWLGDLMSSLCCRE